MAIQKFVIVLIYLFLLYSNYTLIHIHLILIYREFFVLNRLAVASSFLHSMLHS